MEKVISVISWDEVLKNLPDDNPNKELCDIITTLCKDLKKENKDYVYRINLEFGDKIIDKGSRFLYEDNYYIIKNEYEGLSKTIQDFKNDLSYSHDPLGMVERGIIEVFIENNCDEIKYNVPLNIIQDGGLFGLFGTLDIFSNIASDFKYRNWFVTAGNSSSLLVASPFHIKSNTGILNDDDLENYFQDGKSRINPDKWTQFIKKYSNDSWILDLIYFPKCIVELVQQKNSGLLFQEGWRQSFSLRNSLLFDPAITNEISTTTITFYHDKIFINTIYNYIHKVIEGEASVFVPLKDGNHIFFKSFENFKQNTKIYDTSNIFALPFIFKPLESNECGILPISMLPIIHDYKLKSLNMLLNDLNEIDKKIKSSFKIMPHLDGYTSSTGGKEDLENKKSIIKLLAKKSLDFKNDKRFTCWHQNLDKLSLTSKEFNNFIVIKKIQD